MNLTRIFTEQLCPVCGYQLKFTPWAEQDKERHCPCCGIHFGDDDAEESKRDATYLKWRERWIGDGQRWWSKDPEPANFDPAGQLVRLELISAQSI